MFRECCLLCSGPGGRGRDPGRLWGVWFFDLCFYTVIFRGLVAIFLRDVTYIFWSGSDTLQTIEELLWQATLRSNKNFFKTSLNPFAPLLTPRELWGFFCHNSALKPIQDVFEILIPWQVGGLKIEHGAKRIQLLRGLGVAGSIPVIPTSIYKERPSRGRSSLCSLVLFRSRRQNFTSIWSFRNIAYECSGPGVWLRG